MGPEQIFGIVSRWIHIASAVCVLGGLIFARAVLVPAGHGGLLSRYRGILQAGMAGLLLSGIYNLLHKTSTPPPYHALFGVKFLLALHVFAVAALAARPDTTESKRARQLTGVVISGVLILAISAVLRFLSQ